MRSGFFNFIGWLCSWLLGAMNIHEDCVQLILTEPMPEVLRSFNYWTAQERKEFFSIHCQDSHQSLIWQMFPPEPIFINKDLRCIQCPNIPYNGKNVLVAGYQRSGDDYYVIRLYDRDSLGFDIVAEISLKAQRYILDSGDTVFGRLTAVGINRSGSIFVADYSSDLQVFDGGSLRKYDMPSATMSQKVIWLNAPVTTLCCSPDSDRIRGIVSWDKNFYVTDRSFRMISKLEIGPIIDLWCCDFYGVMIGRAVDSIIKVGGYSFAEVYGNQSTSFEKDICAFPCLSYNRSIWIHRWNQCPLDIQWFVRDEGNDRENSFLVIVVAVLVCEMIDAYDGDIEKVRLMLHPDYLELLRKVPCPCNKLKQLLVLEDAAQEIVDLRVAYDHETLIFS